MRHKTLLLILTGVTLILGGCSSSSKTAPDQTRGKDSATSIDGVTSADGLAGTDLAADSGVTDSDSTPVDTTVPAGDVQATDGISTDSVSADVTPPPLKCFDFSVDPNTPLAIDGVFDAKSPTWRRPHDDPAICPATALLPTTAAPVPMVAYAFCNTTNEPQTFNFEMITFEGPNGEKPLDDAYLILYTGIGIPDNPLQCLAVNDDIPDALDTGDSEILGVVVPPGGAITVVGTTFTFDPNDGTGTGYYVLVVAAPQP